MKKNPRLTTTSCLAILALATASTSMAVTLVNGGFEVATAPGAPTGWTSASTGTNPPVTSTAYARTGSQSLLIDSTGAGDWSSPNVSQSFAAAPGEEFSFQGYMLRPGSVGGSFGLLKMEFRDSANATITVPAGNITTGVFAFGGVESIPRLNDTNVGQDTWLLTEARVIAPAGTTSVGFFVLNVNSPGAAVQMYFDDVSATLIPEPSALALTGLGLACLVGRRRRK